MELRDRTGPNRLKWTNVNWFFSLIFIFILNYWFNEPSLLMDFLFCTLFFCGILFLFLLFLSYYAHDNYRVALLKENNACIIMTLDIFSFFNKKILLAQHQLMHFQQNYWIDVGMGMVRNINKIQMVIIWVSYKCALNLFIVLLTENETLTLHQYPSSSFINLCPRHF